MAAHSFSPEMVEQLRALAHAGHNGINIARVLNERFGSTLTPQAVRVKCVALGVSFGFAIPSTISNSAKISWPRAAIS